MSSAALVGTDGSVDWCCLPRFDSPSIFGALLDQDIGGRYRISPAAPCVETSQEYIQDTNVLQTTFRTETGVVSIVDFMPIPDDDEDGSPDIEPNRPPEIHRIVTCKSGHVDMQCEFQPRHDYARVVPTLRALRNGTGGAVEADGRGTDSDLCIQRSDIFQVRETACQPRSHCSRARPRPSSWPTEPGAPEAWNPTARRPGWNRPSGIGRLWLPGWTMTGCGVSRWSAHSWCCT